MTDILHNLSTDLNTQATHHKSQSQHSNHQEKPSQDQPDQQVPQENNQESSSKTQEIFLIEKKEIIVEFTSTTQPILQDTYNRADYQALRRSQDPKEVSSELHNLHAKVDKILGKYKTSNIPVYPQPQAQPVHSSVENILRNSTYLNNLNKVTSTETILRNSTYLGKNGQERSKSRGHASPTKSPTKSVRFADDYYFSRPDVYQSQISNNLSVSPVRTREVREERPLRFSGYSSTVNTNTDVDRRTIYDQRKLDDIINRITGTPSKIDHNIHASKALDVSPQTKSPLFDNYQSQIPQYVTVESRFEMEPLTSHSNLAGHQNHQNKLVSLTNSIDNLAVRFGEQGEKSPEQLYAEHAQRFFEAEENLKDFDFSKYKRI